MSSVIYLDWSRRFDFERNLTESIRQSGTHRHDENICEIPRESCKPVDYLEKISQMSC